MSDSVFGVEIGKDVSLMITIEFIRLVAERVGVNYKFDDVEINKIYDVNDVELEKILTTKSKNDQKGKMIKLADFNSEEITYGYIKLYLYEDIVYSYKNENIREAIEIKIGNNSEDFEDECILITDEMNEICFTTKNNKNITIGTNAGYKRMIALESCEEGGSTEISEESICDFINLIKNYKKTKRLSESTQFVLASYMMK